nr:MAG TPA: hypothetical protein [Caudoviricetes sp.]
MGFYKQSDSYQEQGIFVLALGKNRSRQIDYPHLHIFLSYVHFVCHNKTFSV